MAHLPHLIIDLALILAAAALVTLLFRWLRQPLVLGYIIAGFLVGPYFKWLPTISEIANIRIWAEIGVIFLLFSLGLEFSFKKLLKVGGSASITALVEVAAMMAIGYGTGKALGWSGMDSLFLGGILSISSTTIIIRAFDELGFKTKQFAVLVFGVLIVEDLVAIVLMVLLSTLAVSRQFAGMEMLVSILRLLFFLAIWFLCGIFFIPTLLRKARTLISEEILLILSVALCLAMVVFADSVGFSPALGAFVMGSILAETTKAEKIEHLVKPVKDLFGAIFFVSVGMLIDPAVLAEYAPSILLLCGVTIAGKILSTLTGALLSGQPLQTSVQAGFSVAQIGEFSFIIATLGLTLGVTSDFLYPLAVAVSAVTTLTTPYLIQSSAPFYRWLSHVLPPALTDKLTQYSTQARKASHRSEWRQFIRSTVINTLFLSIIIVAIIIASAGYVYPWINSNGHSVTIRIIACIITLLVLAPFIWALAIRRPPGMYRPGIVAGQYRALLYLVRLARLGLAVFSIGFLIHLFFNLPAGILFTVLIMALLILFSGKIQQLYDRLEQNFFSNLNQRELSAASDNRAELAPWQAHIVPVLVAPDAAAAGRTLQDLQWREQLNLNVVMIQRGDHHIPAPGKTERIYPQDKLLVLGTDIQVQRLKVLLRQKVQQEDEAYRDVELYQYQVSAQSPLAGKTIRDTALREKAKALVVGVERQQERILNPGSDFILQENDVVFIVGNPGRVKEITGK